MLSEKTFDTGEILLNYAEGPSMGPPLVALHGATGNWQGQEPLIERLMPLWHIYACDLRGHGKSGRADDRYRLTDYVGDIRTLLQHRVGAPAVMIGHSLGALVALGVAADRPETVRALVLLDPPLYAWRSGVTLKPEYSDWFHWVYETTTSAQSRADVMAKLKELDPLAAGADLEARAERISCVAPGTVRALLDEQLFTGFDLARALQRLTCPTLLLRGSWDRGACVRNEDVAFVRANVPGAVIVSIPDADHMFPMTRPEIVVEELHLFLAGRWSLEQ